MARPKRDRLDALLVARGLAPDRRKAAAMVMAGEVIVGEHRVDKAGQAVREDAVIRIRGRVAHGYVSRGGLKLAGALDHYGVDPTGRVAVDLGASTGGFTDCLLQRGAAKVYAVDVGYGLLHWTLQKDPRVVDLSRTHAADLDRARVPDPVDLVVADISFNTLTRLVAPALTLCAPGAQVALLVKPQFEADAADVGAGGVVRDDAVRAAAGERVAAALTALGVAVTRPWVDSPVAGAKGGNVELLLHGTLAR